MRTHRNFLNLPDELSDKATARYAVLRVPYEGTVSYKTGTAAGPDAIIEASAQVERLDEETLTDHTAAGIATYPPIRSADSPQEQMKRVRATSAKILSGDKFLLTLGGEHSITAPIVESIVETHGRVSVLQIDAHADLRETYCGTRCSHGAVMRRVLEITDSLCQVGIRSFSKEELDECPGQVKRFITPRMISRDARWIDKVIARLGKKVYVTIDIDALDPAYAPGTGTPEPGGMDWLQITDLLRSVCSRREVVGADIVEVRPIPPNHITEYLAARLAYKIIAYHQRRLPAGGSRV